MAKFFITNNKEFARKEKNYLSLSNFELSCTYESDSLYAYSTKKMHIDNCNYYVNQQDFVIATGTLLNKDEHSIENILNSFVDIDSFRNASVGQYAIVRKRDGEILIWGDEIGVYDVFYFYKDGTFVVSNSLYDMALSLEGLLSINENNLIERCFISGILGGETIYNEIFRLSGHEHIQIILERNDFCIVKEKIHLPFLSSDNYDEVAKDFANVMKEKAHVVVKQLGNPDIFMTGGLDARISLATYLSLGSKPTLNYGIGNSLITNTKKTDLDLDKEFMKRFQLSLHTGSWETPNPVDKDWSDLVKEYGFFIHIYGGSHNVTNMLSHLSENISTFGYGGELYRNLPWVETMKKSYFSVEQFVDEYYAPSRLLSALKKPQEFRTHILRKVHWVCEKYGLSPNKIKREDNVFFLLEYRKYADTRMLNYLNLFKYSNLLLMEKDIVRFCRIDTSIMKQSKFMLNVINELYPDVLELPVFSHCMLRIYDRTDMVLGEPYDPDETFIHYLYRKYKKNIPYCDSILIFFKKTLFSKSEEQKQLENFVKEKLEKDECVKISSIVDLRSFLIYIQYKYVLNFFYSRK